MTSAKVVRKGSYQGVPQWGISTSSEITPSKVIAKKWAALENARRSFTLYTASVLLFASICWGQNFANSAVQPQYIPEHPQHADQHGMRPEVPLMSSGVTSGHGERPLWEVYHPSEVDLAEFARQYRLQHKKEPKSGMVYTN